MMLPIFRTFLLFGILATCLAVSSFNVAAQNTVGGAFQGDVSNRRTGEPIAGVVVQIVQEQSGIIVPVITDSKGRFYQGLLAPGFYQLKVNVPGFRPRLIRLEVKLSKTGEVIPVPVPLEPEDPAATQPSQAVLEEPDDIRLEINTSDARRDGSTKKEDIAQIPIGTNSNSRSFDEIATLLPGVVPAPQTIGDVAGPGVGPGVGSAGQFSANGLRSRANNFTVDGSDNNDEDIGVRRQGFIALIPQPLESIQEFNIITLLAPAQYGRNLGAQVNVVSRAGGNILNGTLYGLFNSHHLNARNYFDSSSGDNVSTLRTTTGQAVSIDGQPITVRNQSGGEDTFTFGQTGATLGGAIVPNRLFYFFSGEFQKINATKEKSFVVPTVEQRGPFRTGATGTAVNFFTGANLPTPLFPTAGRSNAVFSLFPFPNDPSGIFGDNTFTKSLPASGRGAILSARLDDNFSLFNRKHTLTGRYNFTDDERTIPAVNEAIFSTVLSRTQTQNVSLFLNSNPTDSGRKVFNQVRLSFGRTHLVFDEVRDAEFLIPSDLLPAEPFLLNSRAMFNVSLPQFGGAARYTQIQPGANPPVPTSSESLIGPVGQINISGFSPIGADVYNFPQDRINKTYQLADEVTWRLTDHVLVFGADMRRTDLNSDLPRLSRTLLSFNGAPRLIESGGNPCSNGGISTFCFLPASDPRAIIRPEDLAGLGAASNSIQTLNVDRPGSRVDLRYHQLNFYGQDTWRLSQSASLSFGLRYEFNTPLREVDGLIEQTFADTRLSILPVLKRLINDRKQLFQPDRNNFAPRVGVAIAKQLFGSGRISVFRAGYGAFYDQILGSVANQSRNVFPRFLTLNFGGLSNFPNQQLFILNPATSVGPAQIPIRQPGTLNTYNSTGFGGIGFSFSDFVLGVTSSTPNAINVTLPTETLQTPRAQHFSFIFEQQLNQYFSLSAGYVGTRGANLLRFTTPNLGSSLTVAPTNIISNSMANPNVPRALGVVYIPQRPLDRTDSVGNAERLGAVNQYETTAKSAYDSLQMELRGRIRNKLNLQVSYTLSNVEDEVSDVFDMAGAFVLPQNSLDLRAERGPANFDVPHRLVYSAIYNFGKNDTLVFLQHLTNNLQVAATGRFRSGQPFTVNSVIDINLDGNLTDRLNSLSGIEITGERRQPISLTTSNTGSLLAAFGQNGVIGRNTFRAGNVLELDLSFTKQFVLGSRNLSFRADIFNFINRANFGVPVRLLELAGFGKAVSTVTPGRRVQFSIKYNF